MSWSVLCSRGQFGCECCIVTLLGCHSSIICDCAHECAWLVCFDPVVAAPVTSMEELSIATLTHISHTTRLATAGSFRAMHVWANESVCWSTQSLTNSQGGHLDSWPIGTRFTQQSHTIASANTASCWLTKKHRLPLMFLKFLKSK